MNFQKLDYKSKLTSKHDINHNNIVNNNITVIHNILHILNEFNSYLKDSSSASNEDTHYYKLYKEECDMLIDKINNILLLANRYINHDTEDIEHIYQTIKSLLTQIDKLRTTISNDNKTILSTINDLKNNAKLLYGTYKKGLRDLEVKLQNEELIKTKELDRILTKNTDYINLIKQKKNSLELEYVKTSNTMFNKTIELNNIDTELKKYIDLKTSYRHTVLNELQMANKTKHNTKCTILELQNKLTEYNIEKQKLDTYFKEYPLYKLNVNTSYYAKLYTIYSICNLLKQHIDHLELTFTNNTQLNHKCKLLIAIYYILKCDEYNFLPSIINKYHDNINNIDVASYCLLLSINDNVSNYTDINSMLNDIEIKDTTSSDDVNELKDLLVVVLQDLNIDIFSSLNNNIKTNIMNTISDTIHNLPNIDMSYDLSILDNLNDSSVNSNDDILCKLLDMLNINCKVLSDYDTESNYKQLETEYKKQKKNYKLLLGKIRDVMSRIDLLNSKNNSLDQQSTLFKDDKQRIVTLKKTRNTLNDTINLLNNDLNILNNEIMHLGAILDNDTMLDNLILDKERCISRYEKMGYRLHDMKLKLEIDYNAEIASNMYNINKLEHDIKQLALPTQFIKYYNTLSSAINNISI